MKRSTILAAAALIAVAIALAICGPWTHPDWWFTPAQRAERFLRRQNFAEAAKVASDPAQQGAALYRAGQFKEAAAAFARDPSAAGAYNRGNTFVMLGKYDDAIKSYDRALTLQPGWTDAEENRQLATIRRGRLKTEGGDETGGQVKADKIVFGKGKAGQPVEVAAGEQMSDSQLQALWLRRVQTKPADFLRAKFAYQAQEEQAK